MGKLRHFNSAVKATPKLIPIAEQEPCIGVGVIPTSHGLKVAVIIRVKNGDVICDAPGGKPDPGETPENAVMRETGEEAGYKVIVGEFLGSMDHPFKPGLQRHYYEVTYVKGLPSNRVRKEHEGLILVDPENAIAMLEGRIPQSGVDFIRAEVKRYEMSFSNNDVVVLQPPPRLA